MDKRVQWFKDRNPVLPCFHEGWDEEQVAAYGRKLGIGDQESGDAKREEIPVESSRVDDPAAAATVEDTAD